MMMMMMIETGEHESDVYSNCNWFSWYSLQRINKETGGVENKRTRGDHPNFYMIEISQNTEKSPEDLMRLGITQTPLKDHQLRLMGKKSQGVIMIIVNFWLICAITTTFDTFV